MSKNVVVTERLQMTSQYGACALHAGKARLHSRMLLYTPILRVLTDQTCCFSTAVVIHERLSMLRFTYIACIVSFRFVGTFRSRTANGFGVCSWGSHMCVVKWVSNEAVVWPPWKVAVFSIMSHGFGSTAAFGMSFISCWSPQPEACALNFRPSLPTTLVMALAPGDHETVNITRQAMFV
jgi:hypothetical protein